MKILDQIKYDQIKNIFESPGMDNTAVPTEMYHVVRYFLNYTERLRQLKVEGAVILFWILNVLLRCKNLSLT